MEELKLYGRCFFFVFFTVFILSSHQHFFKEYACSNFILSIVRSYAIVNNLALT